MKPSLFQNLPIKPLGDHYIRLDPGSIALPAMIRELFAEKPNDKCLHEISLYLPVDKSGAFFLQQLKELGGREVSVSRGRQDRTHNLVWEEGMISLHYYDSLEHSPNVQVNGFLFDAALAEKIDGLFRKHKRPPVKKGYVFAIVRSGSNLKTHQIGYAGVPLERGNYTDQVIADYEYVVQDFNSKSPSGRIVILDGSPGSGKTYLTRSLLMAVPEATFILVPPAMVNSLGAPELLPLLVKNKADYATKGPTILILEDADNCLAPRASDNISYISALLNLGDGIFGSVCDIRVIATTNVPRSEMDTAIMRPGRLSRHINIEALPYEKANEIHQRLISLPFEPEAQKEEEPSLKPRSASKKTWTLAEIYAAARKKGWQPSEIEEPKIPDTADDDEEADDGE
jgi:energy-coupling factor transporter ATP-binding protein EcfA2